MPRTRPQLVSPPRDPTVIVVLAHDAHELDRRLAMPGTDAARVAITTICGRGDSGLVAGDRLRVVAAADIDNAPLPPPRVKHG
jgi:hypothetical protein